MNAKQRYQNRSTASRLRLAIDIVRLQRMRVEMECDTTSLDTAMDVVKGMIEQCLQRHPIIPPEPTPRFALVR